MATLAELVKQYGEQVIVDTFVGRLKQRQTQVARNKEMREKLKKVDALIREGKIKL